MTSRLPFPERVLEQHIFALGKTGSGKSSALRVIFEHQLDKKKRVVIVDPKGDWWGLKTSADGRSPGYPVIMFGNFKEPRAVDVPINPQSGKNVAELIATGNRPCVIGFRGWMPADLTRFWLDFAPALFNMNEGELNIGIDEVHNFAPKGKILDPQAGKCLHWTNRILSEGRGLGMKFVIASQRPQKVHNDTLDNCETLIALRVTHPRSRDAAEEWINARGDKKLGAEVLGTLAEMKTGEAWVWSPDVGFGPKRVTFPMFQTFDSFAPPQLQRKVSEAGWSEVNLDQVKQKLAAVIAEAKANDPKELRSEVQRLRAELAKKSIAVSAPAPAPQVKTVEIPVFSEHSIDAMYGLKNDVETWGRTLEGVSRDLESLRSMIQTAVTLAQNRPQLPMARPVAIMPTRKTIQAPATRVAQTVSAHDGEFRLNRSQVDLVRAMTEAEAIGRQQISRTWLAHLAGVSPSSSGFEKNVGVIRREGLVEFPQDGMVALTPAGRALVPAPEHPLTTAELLDRICGMVNGSQSTLLRILHENFPNSLTREELAGLANVSPTSSGFEKNVGTLHARDLADYPTKGEVRCAEWMFLDDSAGAAKVRTR